MNKTAWVRQSTITYTLKPEADDGDSDLQHHMSVLSLDGKLCLAPFKETATVLDIGTGTGIWAIQFARLNPRTKASLFDFFIPGSYVQDAIFILLAS